MLAVQDAIDTQAALTRIVMQVHDELALECLSRAGLGAPGARAHGRRGCAECAAAGRGGRRAQLGRGALSGPGARSSLACFISNACSFQNKPTTFGVRDDCVRLPSVPRLRVLCPSSAALAVPVASISGIRARLREFVTHYASASYERGQAHYRCQRCYDVGEQVPSRAFFEHRPAGQEEQLCRCLHSGTSSSSQGVRMWIWARRSSFRVITACCRPRADTRCSGNFQIAAGFTIVLTGAPPWCRTARNELGRVPRPS